MGGSLIPRRVRVRVGDRIRVSAAAKLNLGLEILGRRPDGWHELVTLYQSITLRDRLDLTLEETPGVRLTVRAHGLGKLDLGPDEQNLAVRAAERLRIPRGQPRGLHVALHKRIPVGAGLGGGSADAAAVLMGVDALRGLGLSRRVLETHAAALGSDVAFCLEGGTALGAGRGEILQSLPPLSSRWVVLVYPNLTVSTREVYQAFKLGLTPLGPLRSLLKSPYSMDFRRLEQSGLRNDLEPLVLEQHATVRRVVRELGRLGSGFVRVSGSGSSVFGFAPDRARALRWAARLARDGHWTRVVRFARQGCSISARA